MEPRIQYAKTEDGVNIAYTTLGQGAPLIFANGCWLSMSSELGETFGGPFYEAIAERHTVICYDRRGAGLSDRDRKDFTLEADANDLEALVDHLGLERFALFGNCALGHAAIAYATRHPDRLSHLILYAAFAHGASLSKIETQESIVSLAASHWGIASRTIADMFVPTAEGDVTERLAQAMRDSCAPSVASEFLRMMYAADVTDLLASVRTPTLVMNRERDRGVPFRMARELAAGIPDAHLVTLEGMTHLFWYGDSSPVRAAIADFLGDPTPLVQAEATVTHTILFTDMASSTALTQRLGDAAAQEVRRTHNDIVRGALSANGGNEIKHTGDGIMASFTTASSALECAIAIQRGVADHKAEHPDSPLGVYVGLNAGEPIAEDDDLFGTSVDLAKRICDHAEPGQVVASNVVRELASGKGFLFSDLGDVVPKGFEDPVKLWEVRWREEA